MFLRTRFTEGCHEVNYQTLPPPPPLRLAAQTRSTFRPTSFGSVLSSVHGSDRWPESAYVSSHACLRFAGLMCLDGCVTTGFQLSNEWELDKEFVVSAYVR